MLRYRLDDLGWCQFEQLCQSLLKVKCGVGIESWSGPSDLGRDAWYRESIVLANGIPTRGPFIFQAKFVEGASAAGSKPEKPLMSAVKKECKRIEIRIAQAKWPKNCSYVLLTNVNTPRGLREDVENEIKQKIPCLLYTSPSPRDATLSRMPSSA